MTAEYGLPYFQNFIRSGLTPNMVRSMCCRLQLDLRELLKRGNGLFGSAEQTESLGVVPGNCVRLRCTYEGDEPELPDRLDELLETARNGQEIKRMVMQRHLDTGLFPYTQCFLGTLPNHFSTIGVNGLTPAGAAATAVNSMTAPHRRPRSKKQRFDWKCAPQSCQPGR